MDICIVMSAMRPKGGMCSLPKFSHMIKRVIYILYGLLFSFGYSNISSGFSNKGNNDSMISKLAIQYDQDSIKNLKAFSCISTIRKFLKWYKEKYTEISSIQLVLLSGNNDLTRYKVNFDNAKKYIDLLHSSGFFANEFLKDKINYFQKCDKIFEIKRQKDGPPLGFEADLILFTQEPESVFEKSESMKIDILKKRGKGTIELRLQSTDNNLLFKMDTNSGQCLIRSIEFEVNPMNLHQK
jgi:hypothetical protein